ncbi:MAG: hypothetical protein AAGF45_01775 [Pseudomonadota bacterium]
MNTLNGLSALKRDNPWPDFPYGEVIPFSLAIDGGGRSGREIIINALKRRNVKLMVEVGCFLGGSAQLWLKQVPDLTLIGVDPWEGNWSGYIETMAVDPIRSRTVWHFDDEEIAFIVETVRRHGNFATACNNLRLYKDRFIPVRRYSPEALHYLRSREIFPDAFYLDGDKLGEELEVCRELFPNALICGDDWLWPDNDGTLRMQEKVTEFAARHGLRVKHKRQSWVLLGADEDASLAG